MTAVSCGKCDRKLPLPLCIYNETELILAPEEDEKENFIGSYLELGEVKTKPSKFCKFDIKCSRCHAKLGKMGETGPNGEDGYKFSLKDLKLEGFPGLKKPKELLGKGVFEERSSSTFYGIDTSEKKDDDQAKIEVLDTIFPSLDDIDASMEGMEHVITFDSNCTPRPFQIESYIRALSSNSIIVLPTGAGKTMVATLVIAKMVHLNPSKLVFFLVDRTPLVMQQTDQLRRFLNEHYVPIESLYGETSSPQRLRHIASSSKMVVVMTAEILLNLLKDNLLSMEQISLIVFDEAHHGRSKKDKHVYKRIMNDMYDKVKDSQKRPLILGLTASPVGENNAEKTMVALDEISETYAARFVYPCLTMENLGNYTNIPNLEEVVFEYHSAETVLLNLVSSYLHLFLGYLQRKSLKITKEMIESLKKNVSVVWKGIINAAKEEKEYMEKGENCDGTDLRIIVDHMDTLWKAFDLNEIEGPEMSWKVINEYLVRNRESLTKNDLIRCHLPHLLNAPPPISYPRKYSTRTDKLLRLLQEHLGSNNPTSRGIVFVQKKDYASNLKDIIQDDELLSPLKSCIFLGTSDEAWSYEKQKETLDKFRAGQCRLLISTSVLEEGLDVQECNLVVRFNSTYSLTSFIQSRGRARKQNSQFRVFGTKEEIEFFKNIQNQEIHMQRAVREACLSRVGKEEQARICKALDGFHTVVIPQWESAIKKAAMVVKDGVLMLAISSDSEDILNGIKGAIGDGEEAFFEKSRKRIFFNLKLADEKEAHFDCLNRFLQLPTIPELVHPFHMEMLNFNASASQPVPIRLIGEDLSFGYLANNSIEFQTVRHQFDSFDLPLDPDNLEWNFRCKQDILTFHVSAIIESRIYVQYAGPNNDFLTVIFPIKSAPRFGTLNEKNEFVRRPIADLAFTPFVLSVRIAFQDDDLKKFVTFCQSFHVQVAFASITIVQPGWSSDLSVLQEFLASNDDTEIFENGESDKLNIVSYLSNNPWISPLTVVRAIEKHGRKGLQVLDKISPSSLWNDQLESAMAFQISIVEDSPSIPLTPTISKDNYVWVRRMIITPSRFILTSPMLIQSSRVLRLYESTDFLLVQFRAEDLDRFDNGEAEVLNHFRTLMIDGIDLPIPNGKFRFLGFSNSQFRERHGWFTRACMGEIHRMIGAFETTDNFCRGKVTKRLGLAFSSSIPTMNVTDEEIGFTFEDIVRGKVNFSDGIGRISLSFAREISADYLKLDHVPSAFQIRVAGIKGVVTVCPEQYLKEGLRVQFRDSMKKCPSQHQNLEMLSYARLLPATLNQQIINLLSSLGIGDDVFMDLLDRELELIRLSVCDASKFKSHLEQMPMIKNLVDPILAKGIRPLREPFFLKLLQSKYDAALSNIRDRFRITVEEGACLMGVLDESGEVPEGHIFIRIKDVDPVTEAIVTRMPCHHPGDIQKVKIYKPETLSPFLENMIDCVVFSQHGNTSIPSACAGGDLDGDIYTVIWDRRLIPKVQKEPFAMDYRPAKKMEEPVTISDVINFTLLYWNSDNLGNIANAHVVACDRDPHGACSEDAIKLAELHAIAVDFPKTEIPAKFDKSLMPTEYPDFMNKPASKSYTSEKVLGVMYRKCRAITWIGDNAMSFGNFQGDLYCEGYQLFLDQVTPIYKSYCLRVHGLLCKYGLESEIEIVSGSLLNLPSIYKSSKERNSLNLAGELEIIWDSFRLYLEETFDFSNAKEFHQVFYACYHVAHNDTPILACLSFPWILGHHLQSKANMIHVSDLPVHEVLGRCIYDDWNRRQHERISSLRDRLQVSSLINFLVQKRFPGSAASLFGSSANFLFLIHPQISDIDICVTVLDGNVELEMLRNLLESHGDSTMAFSEIEILDKFTPPIIRLKAKLDGSREFDVDISVNQQSALKLALLVPLYDKHPYLVPVICYLSEFLKKPNCKLINSFGFAWLLIWLLDEDLDLIQDKSMFERAVTDPEIMLTEFYARYPQFQSSQFEMLTFWEDRLYKNVELKSCDIGNAIMTVLKRISCLEPFALPDPVYREKEACVTVEQGNPLFAIPALKLLHVISRFAYSNRGDLLSLIGCVDKSLTVVSLKPSAARIYRQNISYQQYYLFETLRQEGVDANQYPKLSYSSGFGGLLHVTIEGEERSLRLTEEYFKVFIERVEDRRGRERRRTCFAQDSSLLLYPFYGSGSSDDQLSFMMYKGAHHFEHIYALLETEIQADQNEPEDDRAGVCLARFNDAYQRQLSFQSAKFHENPELFKDHQVRVVTRFGSQYFFDVDTDLRNQLKLPTVKKLEEALATRGIYQPWNNLPEPDADSAKITGSKDSNGKSGLDGKDRMVKEDNNGGKDEANEIQQKPRSLPLSLRNNSMMETPAGSSSVRQSFFTRVYDQEVSWKTIFGDEQRPGDIYAESHWIDLCLSYSDYRVRLEPKTLKVQSISTRAVRWFAANFFGKRNGNSTQDMRIYLDASKLVPVEDPIWQQCKNLGAILTIKNDDDPDGIEINPKFTFPLDKIRVSRRQSVTRMINGFPVTLNDSDMQVFSFLSNGSRKIGKRERHKEIELAADDPEAISRDGFSSFWYQLCFDAWSKMQDRGE